MSVTVDGYVEQPAGLLTFKFENKAPVAVEDLTGSLNAFAQSYEDYLAASGASALDKTIKLYVHDLRTGSIIAVLQAISEQGHLLFGEHGVISTVRSTFEHLDTIAGFLTGLNDTIQYFLGAMEKDPPTKKSAEQVARFLEPAAKDAGSNLILQFNGNVKAREIHLHYNSQQANAVQNNVRRYVGPTIPTNQIYRDELLVLAQIRGNPKAKTGDKGIIESISKSEIKLLMMNESIKKNILDAPENPFQQVFVVDVEVKTIDGKPALYKILELKDNFEKP